MSDARQGVIGQGVIGQGAAILLLAAVTSVGSAATAAAQAQPQTQTFALSDTKGLVAPGATLEAVEYKGRKAVKMTKGPGGDGLAVLTGTDFQDGTIEADIAVKVMAPPGVRMPGFIGVAFRARPDGSKYELFYLRPRNARVEDQAMRNHAAQYTSAPDHPWFRLRNEWPWVYETYVDLQDETWIPIKIDVKGRSAALYVNGAAQPTLMVDGLKGKDLRGAVALSGFANQESYFSNVRITHAAPQPVKNGGDVAGAWKVRCVSDAGPFEGTLQVTRDGKAITGTWSGTFGNDRPVTGTWRDGYVELTFSGDWPKERGGQPGTATVAFAGWIDGTSAKGRMRVDRRADGSWTATRTP